VKKRNKMKKREYETRKERGVGTYFVLHKLEMGLQILNFDKLAWWVIIDGVGSFLFAFVWEWERNIEKMDQHTIQINT
jgi:hypothetical protein